MNKKHVVISFGGIPNSSLTPYAIFDYIGAFLCNGFAHVDNIIPVIKNNHMAAPVKVARQQTTPDLCLWNLHQHVPELFGTFRTCRRNLHQHAPELSRTLRNLPRPSGTNLLEPSGTYLRNLRQHTPEPSGTYIVLHRNSPEPSGTRLRNLHLHQHTPELSGTFRNLPEPSSGTCSCDPHRHTPELIWAEDPISLRCWGKTHVWSKVGDLLQKSPSVF